MQGSPRAENALPEHLENMRSRVGIGFKKINNPVGTYGAHAFASLGVDNSLCLHDFRRNCIISITLSTEEETVFDIIGIDAPIANALRRILLVEVPTMAIENVFIHKNTSIMHDEMLAHRLGLVPLLIDARPFETWQKGDPVTSANTVKFRLRAKCEFNDAAPRDGEAPSEVLYKGSKVMSGALEHVPFPDGSQHDMFGDVAPKPVHHDILLCKLRPGQEIHVEMDATKNIGKEHAKWSPVCTASYRMLPEVRIKSPVRGSMGEKLTGLCPAKVFDIEDDQAVVSRPRDCTMCRECIREEPLSEHVQLSRKRDTFIFHVESTGVMPSTTLVTEALSVLMTKCDGLLKGLDRAIKQRGGADSPDSDENQNELMDIDDFDD